MTNNLTKEQLLALIEETQRLSKKMTKVAETIMQDAEVMKYYCELAAPVANFAKNGSQVTDNFNIQGRIVDFERDIRLALRDGEEAILTEIEKRLPLLHQDEDSYIEEYLRDVVSMEFLSIEPGRVIVKMPMLPCRLRPRKIIKSETSKSIRFTAINGTFTYRDELYSLAMANKDFQTEVAGWGSKTVTFYFVWPTDARSIIDTDAHETKSVLDSLTALIPGGDTAVSTSVCYKTVKAEVENPYTIIVLENGLISRFSEISLENNI